MQTLPPAARELIGGLPTLPRPCLARVRFERRRQRFAPKTVQDKAPDSVFGRTAIITKVIRPGNNGKFRLFSIQATPNAKHIIL
jgi:hypothetical protein